MSFSHLMNDFSSSMGPQIHPMEKNSIKLLDTNFTLLRDIVLSDVRQIIWQPNSQGFLYLSMQGLFKVMLPNGET